ncbi:ER membrane protein complex subunit 1 [Biomphalaria pfeifferi]|uniref:ER membrane protein complex subunit 1 n=1 Tax=Biomphalaria pfeifferi TaxID=112525 RepID=A0AAD8BVE2_BIOPF|nr:ER membrane protein complex subunit 1 [Biomphalaria pfeifferi]
MAKPIKAVLVFLCMISLHSVNTFGLYEDQAGLFDWKQEYVGQVKDFHWDQTPSQSGKKVFIASEKNVVASVNVHDGSIAWRRIFEPSTRGRIDALLHQGSSLVSIHAGGQFVRSWSAPSGSLLWEKSLSDDVDSRASGFFIEKNKKDYLIIATSGTLYCLKMNDGSEEWKAELPHSDTIERWYVTERSDNSFIAIGITPGQRVTITSVSSDGVVSKTAKNVPAPWIDIQTSCIIMEDDKHFVCYSPQTHSLQTLGLDNVTVFKQTELLEFPLTKESKIEGLVPGLGSAIKFRSASDRLVFMVLTPQETFTVHKVLEKTYSAEIVNFAEKYILLTLTQADAETLQLTARDQSDNSEIIDLAHSIPFAHYHGPPVKMFPFLFSKKKDSSHRPGCKLILVAQDFSIHFAQKSKSDENKSHWRREEALAYILSVLMVDLPVSENQAKFEDEFGTKEEDLLAMFYKRLKAQFSQLRGFAITLVDRALGHHHHHTKSIDAIEEEEPEEEDLIRDGFNLHKIIVVATAPGKIYGIRSHTGKIAWQQFILDLVPFSRYDTQKLHLVLQRSTAHFPHEPQCTVLGVSQKTGNGLLVSFNPVTGAILPRHQSQGHDTGFKVLQAEMLVDMDSDFLKGIVLIDDKIKFHVYPPTSKSILQESRMQHFFHLINPDTGFMTGYRLLPNTDGEIDIEELWNLDLQKSQQTITGVYGKRAIEHVHSQGRVLGDRSVLYKYLNPNLVALVTEGEEQQQSSVSKGPTPFFSIYLVDGVTGHLVYHQTHKRSKGPVKVVHSENWIVYSYFNEKHRRSEIGVLELYEGKEQSNSTAFSSFYPPPPPLVLRQSYIFPVPIYAMEATVTEKGITSKNIIIALKTGGVLSLPKALLDPRRPVIPTPETMEEGTIPYVPEIPLSTEALVNYNRSVFNVDGVFTSPAGLESTSLVFVYGIDIFYTRVTPSRMFDVLKEDFDYLFIGGVLALMIILSFITQKLAAIKALKRAWK